MALPTWTYRAADRGVRGSAPAAAGKGLGVGPCGQVGSWRCTTPSPGAEGRSQNLRTGRAVFPATAPGRWTPSLSLASLSSKAEILAGLMGPFEGAHGPKQDSSLEQSPARGQNPRASHTSGLSGSHSVTGSHPAATGCCGDSQSAPRVPLGLQSSRDNPSGLLGPARTPRGRPCLVPARRRVPGGGGGLEAGGEAAGSREGEKTGSSKPGGPSRVSFGALACQGGWEAAGLGAWPLPLFSSVVGWNQ